MDILSRLASELAQFYEQNCRKPFPYQGCRALLKGTDKRMEGFIPDLDLFFGSIAGYANGAKKLLKWDTEKVKQAQRMLRGSFFEKHPEYKELEARITPADTPDLYADMAHYEEMRTKVLRLLSMLAKHESDSSQSNGAGRMGLPSALVSGD
jgi:hypothetical protein